MKRNELTEAFREASMEAGYTFYSGQSHRINGEVRIYPAVWLETPILKSTEGRKEGSVTYRVALHLMILQTVAGSQQMIWSRLETDAMSVIRSAEWDERICEISDISCAPARQSLTTHGEISVTLECDVTIWFYI